MCSATASSDARPASRRADRLSASGPARDPAPDRAALRPAPPPRRRGQPHRALAAAVDRVLALNPLPGRRAADRRHRELRRPARARAGARAARAAADARPPRGRQPRPVRRADCSTSPRPAACGSSVCDTSIARPRRRRARRRLAGRAAGRGPRDADDRRHAPPADRRSGCRGWTRSACRGADRDALGDLLARSPQVKRVVAGHVHRAIATTLGGCGVVTCASTNIQAALDFATDRDGARQRAAVDPRARAAGRASSSPTSSRSEPGPQISPCSSRRGGRWRIGGRSPSIRSGGRISGRLGAAPCRAPRRARRPRRCR